MKTYIIAEIGINHNGDLNIAKKLISVASFAGCDAVKFQKRTPDICVPEHQKNVKRDTPWGEMTYLEYKKRVEFEKPEYDEIDRICREQDIAWSASVWDKPSVDFMENYEVPFLKIPSACLTDLDLISYARNSCKKRGIKAILSTGMSTIEEIDRAVGHLEGCSYALTHCNSSYPAKTEELNLRCIQTLRDRYECEVGYSGHEFKTGTSVSTVILGASIIERHVTLDRTMWGSDHLASLEPEGLITMVRAIRDLEKALGDGKKRVMESEKSVREKLRRAL